ncbi:MAG TPA: hypothetical protein VFT75_16840 [Nocardioidaceae bacterium]|jgi:hypothetical protein|nr:hypothetical protein [Nocardioidaceae bacterium]
MGLGTGAFFFAVGAILYWAVDVNLPFIDVSTLGSILMLVGFVVALIALLANTRRADAGPATGVGSGIAMLAIGATLCWAINVRLPFVKDSAALGVILMVGGAISIVATLVMHHQNSRTVHQVTRRY